MLGCAPRVTSHDTGHRIPPRVMLALAAVYVIWSSTYLALRYVVECFPPLLSAGARYVVAGAALFLIHRARGAAAPSGREWLASMPIGGLMFLVGNGFVALAERRVSSGLAAVACAAMPLFACAFSLFFGERPSRREWAGVGVGVTGVVLLAMGELRAAPRMGALLLLAPLGWALGSVLARRASLGGPMSAATMMIGGGLSTLLAGIARGEAMPSEVPLRGALAIAYLVIFGSVVAFSAYAYLLRATTTALATSYAYVNPVLAVLLGAAVGGERLTTALIAPGAIVILGVVIVATGAQRAPRGRSREPVEEPSGAEGGALIPAPSGSRPRGD